MKPAVVDPHDLGLKLITRMVVPRYAARHGEVGRHRLPTAHDDVIVGTNEPTPRRVFEPNPGAADRVDLSNAHSIIAKRCSARLAEKDRCQGRMLSLGCSLVDVEAYPPRPSYFVVEI